MPDLTPDPLTPSTAVIVSAFVKQNRVAIADLSTLIVGVRSALASLGEPPPPAAQESAVALGRLVRPDRVYCAECGKAFKSIKRHLLVSHHLTPAAYLAKWGLKKDHPMVAPNYSASRSSLALSRGLGRKAAPATAASQAENGPLSNGNGKTPGPTKDAVTKAKSPRAKRGAATEGS